MKNLQQIKDEYAKEKGFEKWEEYSSRNLISRGDSIDEIAKRYAQECCKASLKRASENATISTPWHPSMDGTKNVNKESITNEENIVIL